MCVCACGVCVFVCSRIYAGVQPEVLEAMVAVSPDGHVQSTASWRPHQVGPQEGKRGGDQAQSPPAPLPAAITIL